MRVAQASSFGVPHEVVDLVEFPDPGDPGAGEAVVAAEWCPINPSDLVNIAGAYGATRPPLPLVPGVEGVGRVVAIGPGVTHLNVGDRVLLPGSGTWRERVKAPAAWLFALPAGGDPRQWSMLRVNPATAAIMLRDFVPPRAGQWVIQNAANSGVGHCLIHLARDAGMKSVNIVRRPDVIDELRAAGADVVLEDGPGLRDRVRAAIGDGALPLGIDAIGGSATQRLARCVDDGGVIVNYGLLSGEPCTIDARETIFRDVQLRGFWLRRWFTTTAPAGVLALYQELAAKVLDGTLAVGVEAVYPLSRIREALEHAGRGGRSGKILLSFAGDLT